MASKPIITGARARFSVDGKKVAYATGVSVDEEIQYEPLQVLDNVEVEEFVPVGYNVSGTCEYVRVVLQSAKALGWFPKCGKSPAEHLTNILNQGEITMTVEDPITGKVLTQLTGVKLGRQGMQISARNIVGVSVSFVAKAARDEADLAT